jgi:CheY-like chemotaxis protein
LLQITREENMKKEDKEISDSEKIEEPVKAKQELVKEEPVEKKNIEKMIKTVMVVDDDEDIRSTVKTILEKQRYNVIVAFSGEDCLKKLEGGNKPELILMDIMMPGIPVKDVVSKIKGIKILYFSAVKMSDEEKKDLEKVGNVVGFIQKPFDLDELVKKIKSLIG